MTEASIPSVLTVIYILANGAAFKGFIIDEENAKVFKRELTNFATDLVKLVAKARQNSRQLLCFFTSRL